MTILLIVAVIVWGALVALWMVQRHARLLQQAQYDAEARALAAEETKALWDAEARKSEHQLTTLGQAELEVARSRTAEANYHAEQARLARSVIDTLGSSTGDELLKTYSLTMDGLLEAVRRQLVGEKPSPHTLPRQKEKAS